MRFTALVGFTGARVHIPNRSIQNVISYPKGYIRAFLDVRLPEDPERWDEVQEKVGRIARAAYEQFPGILLLPPSFEARLATAAGHSYLRFKFRIWPGQGTVIEQTVKPAVAHYLKGLQDGYADWMVTVHYRAEPPGGDPEKALPRPSSLGPIR